MKPANTIGYLLYHTAAILHRQSDQILQERLGIGMSQFKLLLMLQDHPGVQQRTVAEYLGQTEASISRQIKLLCDKGMLSVKINSKNRREHITLATAKGIKLADAAREVLAEYHAPVFTQLSDKQRQRLTEMLRSMHEQVCREGKPHACNNAHI